MGQLAKETHQIGGRAVPDDGAVGDRAGRSGDRRCLFRPARPAADRGDLCRCAVGHAVLQPRATGSRLPARALAVAGRMQTAAAEDLDACRANGTLSR